MNMRKLIILLLTILLLLTSCVLNPNNGDTETPNGCYRFSMPDHGSPDPNPPLAEYYMQFWDDGTGEGGFWDTPIMESHFFEWTISDGMISFTPDFNVFDQADFSYLKTDSNEYILLSFSDSEVTQIHLSDAIVSRVNFNASFIEGTWKNSRDDSYIFTSDSLFQEGFAPLAWNKSVIPHVIEIKNSIWTNGLIPIQWAVRVMDADTVIMAGYNNILRKQP